MASDISDIVNRIRDFLASECAAPTFGPASADSIAEAEAHLGFKIPPLLKRLYLEVGNGGFGPGYGIIGLRGGRPSDLGVLVETYEQIRAGAQYLQREWPAQLLPFCEWGCNIFSCVDCADPQYRILESEECEITVQGYFLEDFFDMWLRKEEIRGRGKRKTTKQIINPFSDQRIRVAGRKKER